MKILLCYKNFSKECHVSHIGLGVTAAYTAKSLVQAGYEAEAVPIYGGEELLEILRKRHEVTHVVISAQFIPTVWLAKIARAHPKVHFALNCHSNVGFLQAEPNAIKLLREAIDLETGTHNFYAGGNNKRFCKIMSSMYGRPVQFLPNLYYLHGEEPIHKPRWQGGVLKVGVFGSLRVYKNFSTAVTAAVELGINLHAPVEIWMNGGRHDGTGDIVWRTAKAWTDNLPSVELKSFHWASWPEFKRMIGSMNILLQPSYTETFNNVTADGAAEGIPSVVSDTIDWCPKGWIASSDDPMDVARVARHLLFDPHASREGYEALKRYREDGLQYWKKFLQRP